MEKAERQRKEAVDAYRKSDSEHAQIIDSYKSRQNELNQKVTSHMYSYGIVLVYR